MIETVIHHSQISAMANFRTPISTASVLPQEAVGLMVGHNHGRNGLLDTNNKKKTQPTEGGEKFPVSQICTTGHENKTVLLLSVPDTRSQRFDCPRQGSRPTK